MKTATARDPWLDNAKFVLINLVVVGHFLGVFYAANEYARMAWQVIYSFHMPAFVFLAGYHAKPHDPAHVFKSAQKLLVPLISFSVLYEFGYFAFMGKFSGYASQFAPYWVMWFLLSLFVWTISLPYVLTLKYPMTVLLCLSLGIGLMHGVGYPMSLSRIFVFFPFFLLGYRFAEGKLLSTAPFQNRIYMLPALFFILGLLAILRACDIKRLIVLGNTSFEGVHLTWLQGMAMRAELLVISTLAIFSILILVPRQRNWLTSLGGNSIVVYLLHGVFVRGFVYFCGNSIRQLQGKQVLLISLVLGVAVAILLSTPPVRRIYDACMGAMSRLLFRSRNALPEKVATGV